MKSLNHFRIKLSTGPVVELFRRCLVRLTTTIHTIARDRIECVGDSEDARAHVNIFSVQSERITGSIPLFMMLRDNARRALQKLNAAQDLLSVKWMLAHAYPLFFRELRRFAQDRIRHADLDRKSTR